MADWSNDADWSNETDWSSIGGAADESGLLAFFASLLTLIVVLVWRRN